VITIGITRRTPESANEMGKRFIEIKPLPDFVQMIGPYMYPDENEGIKAIAIF
jgi:hypothetical protein